jgi:Domain of unknown function (DUF5615)
MRFLADENFPSSAVAAVREAGHDVVWVGVTGRGASDADVLAWAVREGRIILTFDKDFGELAKNSRLSGPSGIVLFRVPLSGPRDTGPRLASLLASRDDWAGHFAVIEPGRVRMRSLDPRP